MSRIIIWQTIMLFAAVGISACFWTKAAVWSTVCGGLSYLIPTIMAVINLMVMQRIPALQPMALLVAEFGKIFLTSLIMLLVYVYYPAVDWLAFLLGIILVSQAGLFTFRRRLLL
ncbi:ATP synthase subunit I [Neisseriaceae bacterium ESL0693]|nr:ATP synthase subunit I [Neisseriaceae bacterium ESL0693]